MARKAKRGADPVYKVEDAATGKYLKLDGENTRIAADDEASSFATRDEALLELSGLTHRELAADLVRIDS